VPNWILANGLLSNKAAAGTKLAQLIANYRRVEAGIAFPRTCNSMDEREVTAPQLVGELFGKTAGIKEALALAAAKLPIKTRFVARIAA